MQYLYLQEAYTLHTTGYTASWKRLAQFCSVIRAHSVQGQSKEVRWSLTQETCSLPTNNQTTKHAERWSPSIIQENTFVQLPVAGRSMVCPLFLPLHLCAVSYWSKTPENLLEATSAAAVATSSQPIVWHRMVKYCNLLIMRNTTSRSILLVRPF